MNILNIKAFGGLLFLFSCRGGAPVYSGVDTRLLAGVDVPGRIFRIASGDYPLPHKKGPEALRATDERVEYQREVRYRLIPQIW
jgi:hypothetical protein